MNRIKIIIAKHNGDDRKYIFAVPAYMTVCKGDALIVDTARGRQYALAATGEIEIDKDDVEQLGAYRPLKYVQERASAEMIKYITNSLNLPF